MRACLVCGKALGKQARGRPRDFCAEERCQRIAVNARTRTRCGRCACPVLFQDERLSGVCRPCKEDLARTQLEFLEKSA